MSEHATAILRTAVEDCIGRAVWLPLNPRMSTGAACSGQCGGLFFVRYSGNWRAPFPMPDIVLDEMRSDSTQQASAVTFLRWKLLVDSELEAARELVRLIVPGDVMGWAATKV